MNYSNKTVKEIKLLCKELNIKGVSNKKKNELIEILTSLQPQPQTQENVNDDLYDEKILKEQYNLHKNYVMKRIKTTINLKIKVRLPSIPEDISENIIKYLIRNKLNDKTTIWNCKNGDLFSLNEGKQECKCFTINGPISFTPTTNWDIIYFLDARNWFNDIFVLFRVSLKRTSTEWKNINISKTQTYEHQSKQGRRPRIIWEQLKPQINKHCNKVFEGSFNEIFI